MAVKIKVWNSYSWADLQGSLRDQVWERLSFISDTRDDSRASFLTKKNAFLTGLLPIVIALLESKGVEYHIEDARINKAEGKPVLTLEADLRERQEAVVQAVFKHPFWMRGVIDAATNFGKSWIIGSLCTSFKDYSVLVLVHRQELFTQVVEFLSQINLPVHVFGTYKKQRCRDYGRGITVAMQKSLHNDIGSSAMQQYLQSLNVVIVDECHRATGPQYTQILGYCDAYIRLGMSGTPFTGDGRHDLAVEGIFGPTLAKVTNEDLIADGVSLKPTVHIYELTEYALGYNYQHEKSLMYNSVQKIGVIRQEILKNLDNYFLIAVSEKEHGQILFENLIDLPTTVEFIYGGDPKREEKLQDFKDGKFKVIISTEILKEGVNLPKINTLINAAPGKSVVWVKQFVGRVLRTDGINTECKVIDFLDTGANLLAQSRQRANIYHNEKFEVFYYKVT